MNNLNESIKMLGDKLNISIDKMHGVLYNQMMFEMKNDIFWIALSLLIIVVGYFKIIKYYNFLKQFDKYSKDDHKEFWFIVTWGFLGLVSFVAILCGVSDLIQMYANPEYYMIQLLLKK